MRGLRARRDGDVLFGSAGWLFADLMLAVVVMLVLATVTTVHKPPAHHRPPHPVTTTTPPPTTTTPTEPPGMLPNPIEVDIDDVDTNGLMSNNPAAIAAIQQNVRGALAGPLGGRRVGVVLTFGTAPSGSIQRGIQVAGQFNTQVLQALGSQFAGAAYRSYFQNGGDLNKITLDFFVFSD